MLAASMAMESVSPVISWDALQDAVNEASRRRFCMSSVDELDAVQQVLQVGLALLNEATNARLAISKLPPEILTHIFSMVPRDLPSHGIAHLEAKQTYDLVPLTHVCRRWRDIALSASPLWSTVCETLPSHVASHAFRARARHVPLTVYVDRPYPSAALRSLLATDGKHVAELELHDLQELPPHQLASELLSFSAPSLERVVVHSRAARVLHEHPSVDTSNAVQLCRGDTPRLKHLEFHDIPFLPANHFAALTDLSLSYYDSPIAWALDDLLGLLSRSPMLQKVRLDGLPCDLHLRQFTSSSAVELPHLKSLEIGDCLGYLSPVPTLRLLLSHVTLPPDASVRIYGVEACRISGTVELSPTPEDWSTLDINMTFSTLTLVLSRPLSPATFSLQLNTGGTSTALLEHAVTGFIRDNANPHIRTVTISSQRGWSSWCDPRALFSALPGVEVLEVGECYLVPPLLDALRPLGAEASHPEDRQLLCPNLSTLRLPPVAVSATSELLAYLLESRAAAGAPLQFPDASSMPSVPSSAEAKQPAAFELVDISQASRMETARAPTPAPYADEQGMAYPGAPMIPADALSHLGFYFMSDY
ncbi:hypothetical protein FKP32DRAFT_998248 [Trametes sanguinea]|nr:hypothetical protein FKP32DRAFT_998248 [Trametes sanguinea]